MICMDHEQNGAIAAASACSDSRRRHRKAPETILDVVLGVHVPDEAGARTMLKELQEATRLTRRLLAILLCESQHAVRRWQDGSRSPSQAGRWKIALFHRLLRDTNGFEAAHLLAERALRTARDKSRPASERVAALALVPDLADFRRRLGNRVMALAVEMDRGEQRAA